MSSSFSISTGATCVCASYAARAPIYVLGARLGHALGSGAHLTELRRTAVGNVRVADCMSVQQAVDMIAGAPLRLPPEWLEIHPLPSRCEKESLINKAAAQEPSALTKTLNTKP